MKSKILLILVVLVLFVSGCNSLSGMNSVSVGDVIKNPSNFYGEKVGIQGIPLYTYSLSSSGGVCCLDSIVSIDRNYKLKVLNPQTFCSADVTILCSGTREYANCMPPASYPVNIFQGELAQSLTPGYADSFKVDNITFVECQKSG
jgi:hypothetical protein